jgi:hypothetical protein
MVTVYTFLGGASSGVNGVASPGLDVRGWR